jgi:phage-related holin
MFKTLYHIFEQIFAQLKDPIIVFLTTVGIFLGPITELVTATILFAILDFLTAIVAANKNNIEVTSKKMGDTFPKIIMYSIAIIVVHYLDTYVVHTLKTGFLDFLLKIFMDDSSVIALNAAKLTSAVAFLIVIREMKSIDENWKLAFGWNFLGTIKSYIINPILTIKNKFIKNGTEKN